jgi:ATP-binding cassette subfamily B protein
VAISLAGTGLGLVQPYLAKLVVDEGILARDFVALLQAVALFVAVTAFSFVLNVFAGMRYTRVSADILFDMRLELFRHLQRLSPRFYARTPLGDIVSRINGDIGEIQRVTAEAALGWLGQALALVGAVVMLVYLDWRLFLAGLAVLPPALWALARYRRELEDRVRVLRERSADVGTFLIETLQGMPAVVGARAEEREVARFRRRNDSFVEALLAMRLFTYLAGGLPGLLLSLGTAIVLVYGGYRVIQGDATLGTLVAFMAYQARLVGPLQGLMGIWSSLASARASLVRVHALLDTPPEVREAATPVPLASAEGRIAFERVSLAYGRGVEGLSAIDLEIGAGERVAIVGRSGSGKSTLADLLTRRVDPDAGRVLLDGHDVRTLRLSDLRRHVVLVEQDPFVFHASVNENVRYARPEATDAEVEQALCAAGLEELVASMPERGETVVGERGRQLSAGERQRLAIARAFLADPTVLVLDEATGALDPRSEEALLRGWERLMRGRTTLLVTHRLDLARRATRVVVLERGRVVEQGAPATLEHEGRVFRSLFLDARR